MTPSPSRLTETHRRLVLDASVVINLLGTGAMMNVVVALARELHIERRAYDEIKFDPSTRRNADLTLAPLKEHRHLLVSDLSAELIPDFVQLATAGVSNGLDPGEAASIVLAHQVTATVVLDEERAQCAARRHFPTVNILTSLDLLAAPELFSAIGQQGVSDLIYASCMHARMNVASEHAPWVVRTIGTRAQHCLSIKKRFRPAALEG